MNMVCIENIFMQVTAEMWINPKVCYYADGVEKPVILIIPE